MTDTLQPDLKSADARIALLADQQSGAFSRAQALTAGVGRSTIQRRVADSRWLRASPGVYVVTGAPKSWLRDMWCAFLAVGRAIAVTHESALRLRGIDCVPPRPFTFTIPHGSHVEVPGTTAHQIDDLTPLHLTKVSGLPVSRPHRAVVEVAATLRPKQLERVVDEVLHQKLANLGEISGSLQEVMRAGKPGVRKLAALLDAKGDDYTPPASELERALFTALSAGGLPEPRRQFRLPGRGAVDGIVDGAYVDTRIILEADGRTWHTRVAAYRRDRERDTEAARVGWLTLRFTYEQIMYGPAEVCAAVADVRAVRPGRPEAIGPTATGLRV